MSAMGPAQGPPTSGPAAEAPWVPRTELGRRVAAGEITTMSQAIRTGLPLREAQIVDKLLPDLHDEVLDVNMVQRMTDSGRRFKFAVTVVVGNGDGFVGLGRAKGREVGPTIRRAIDRAKLELVEIYRGPNQLLLRRKDGISLHASRGRKDLTAPTRTTQC